MSISNLTLLGVDLGKKRDYSAVVLLECEAVETGEVKRHTRMGSMAFDSFGDLVGTPSVTLERVTENRYKATYIERLPLGAAYTAQVEHIKGLYARLVGQGREVDVVMDRGGVGEGVVDLMRDAKLNPIGIYMTSGHNVTRAGRDYNVPKKDVVNQIDVLLENDRLKIHAGLPYAQLLISELEGFNYEINARGHASFGNDAGVLWREQEHDDLVLACALACWYGEHRAPPPSPRRQSGFSFNNFRQ